MVASRQESARALSNELRARLVHTPKWPYELHCIHVITLTTCYQTFPAYQSYMLTQRFPPLSNLGQLVYIDSNAAGSGVYPPRLPLLQQAFAEARRLLLEALAGLAARFAAETQGGEAGAEAGAVQKKAPGALAATAGREAGGTVAAAAARTRGTQVAA
eukprot:scaffold81151_cov14-Tisochrysis_lutea.AAC.1